MPPLPFQIPSPPALFPTFLIPTPPFRRRQSSTSSTSTGYRSDSISSASPPDDSYLTGHASHLRCARCLTDLALSSQIISKGFNGRHGRAYLVAPTPGASASDAPSLHTAKQRNDALPNLPNTYTHKPVPRQLVTGAHTVGDISCSQCGSVLGWKYISAEEESQRYKVGKFILEAKKVCRNSTWESEDGIEEAEMARQSGMAGRKKRRSFVMPPDAMKEVVEFDSQDEEECEELFMGVWTPGVAGRRRRSRVTGGGGD